MKSSFWVVCKLPWGSLVTKITRLCLASDFLPVICMYSLLEGMAELKKMKIMFEETQAVQGTEVEREDKATGKQPGMLLSCLLAAGSVQQWERQKAPGCRGRSVCDL